jgi:hypothetical protein
MFHSTARAVQGSQVTVIESSKASKNAKLEFVVIDSPPQGITRFFVEQNAADPVSFGTARPLLRYGIVGEPGKIGSLDFFLKKTNGKLYRIESSPGSATDAVGWSAAMTLAAILLAPGEVVVARIAAGNTASKIYVFANFIDLVGPFAHRRTVIGEDWQDVMPAPFYGKLHTPIGFPQSVFWINGYVSEFESTAKLGTLDVETRIVRHGKVLSVESAPISVGEGPAWPFTQNTTGIFNFTDLNGVIPLSDGMSLQARAKLGSMGGEVTAFASYLVTDDPKVHRSV